VRRSVAWDLERDDTAREVGVVEGGVAILKKGNLRVGQSCLGVDQFYLLQL